MPNRATRVESAHRDAASELALRLKSERLASGLSQQRLAALADVSIGTIRALEGGRSVDPSFFTVVSICAALGLDVGVVATLHKNSD